MSVSENIVGHISHFFTVNRPLSILVLVVILLFGALSFWVLPKQYNPEIMRPAFSISLQYQGATTQAATDRVVYELVEKIKTVPGVEDVLTTVTDGATINTTVIFAVGYDATKAKVDLLAQLQQHRYLVRGYTTEPQVMEINPETIPVLHIVFSSASLTIEELRERVVILSHRLTGITGVSELSVEGGYAPALVIELDSQKLTAANLSVSQVEQVLTQSQLRSVAQGVRQSPYQLEMVFDGQAVTPEAVGLLSVGEGVLLRDVASVYIGVSGSRSYVLYQDQDQIGEVVTLSVAKVEGSSAPVVTTAVLQALRAQLETEQFSMIDYVVVGDDGATAAAEIGGLLGNLVTSIAIVAVVLLLFLSARAALVVLIAIPTTLLIVFGLGLLFDQTINRITLFALILSLGLLVDSAIVVVENIYSHLREWCRAPRGIKREQAVAGAVHEIGVGLILSTVTSVIVFLPMLYITGMMGPYMGPIAFFVPVALIVSLLVAVVVVPFIAAHILDPDEQPNRVTLVTALMMTKLTSRYEQFLKYIFSKRQRQGRLLGGVIGLFLISLILPATGLVHFQMLPKADRDQFYVYIDAPVGTDSETVKKQSTAVSALIIEDADVVSIQQFIATAPMLDFNGMFKGAPQRTKVHQATLRVNLTASAKRARSSTEIVNAIRARVAGATVSTNLQVRFMEEPPGPPVQATLVAKFVHSSAMVRDAAANSFATYLATIDGVVDIDTSTDVPISRTVYTYDHTAGAALGVTAESVQQALALLGEPQVVGEYLTSPSAEYAPMILSVPATARQTPADIAGLSVVSQTGTMVPLSSVVITDTQLRPSSVTLEDTSLLTYVTAEIEHRSIVYVTIEIITDLMAGRLPGYTVMSWNLFGLTLATPTGDILTLAWGGEWEMTLENFRDLGIAMGVALVLVYAVLAAQYQRFAVPGYILVTVPLALIGILWGFFILDTLFGIYLTATALIGFIALIGIVVNNAIIYLEYVERSVATGLSYTESLLAAGSARLRPIILTSLTTVLGSLTIAGDPVWSGLAWAIVFGLSLSAILTLIVYPTLLVYFGKPATDAL